MQYINPDSDVNKLYQRMFMNELDHHELFFKPGVSPTSINQFFESPSRFWKYSSLNPNKERKEATPAMIFGRLVHCLALTPEMFEKEFAVQPIKNGELDTIDEMKAWLAQSGAALPSKAKKDDYVAACRQLGGVVWVDVMANFTAAAGRKTIVTQDCWFPDGEQGLMKKCRLDYVRSGLVIEYKTDISPCEQDFMRTIASRGYHRQLAWQVDAAVRIYGEIPRGAIIIAQDKEIHDDIAIYALDAAAIELGKKENAYAWSEINRRFKANDWRTFPEEIMPIGLPKWYEANNPLPIAA